MTFSSFFLLLCMFINGITFRTEADVAKILGQKLSVFLIYLPETLKSVYLNLY